MGSDWMWGLLVAACPWAVFGVFLVIEHRRERASGSSDG